MIKAKPTKKINEAHIRYATAKAKDAMDRYRRSFEKFSSDEKMGHRIAEKRCQACFYIYRGLGGAAITESDCGVCGSTIQNGSTNVAMVCGECSDRHGLCVKCGGDIHAKMRRHPRQLETDDHYD